MLQLAAINPLKNAIFNSGAPTIADIGGGSISSTFGPGSIASITPSGFLGGGGGILSGIGSFFGSLFAKGGAFQNNVRFLQGGGLVTQPTLFGSREGMNIAGEAGTEAVLPLKRTSSGDLGVSSEGSQPPNVFNIDARGADREGFEQLLALIRELDGKINNVNRSIEPRSINAVANNRRRTV
jgi:phage-related minor tail protein